VYTTVTDEQNNADKLSQLEIMLNDDDLWCPEFTENVRKFSRV